MNDENRKYQFSWGLIGDIQLGRPKLGNTTQVEVYRLMQFTFRDVIEKRLGAEMTDRIFYDAGRLAGTEFFQNLMPPVTEPADFISKLQSLLEELGMGILRIEEMDLEKEQLVLTISEDLDCSGLPETGDAICTYDEGFLSAVLESFWRVPFDVKEVDCWCTGDRTCRFKANAIR